MKKKQRKVAGCEGRPPKELISEQSPEEKGREGLRTSGREGPGKAAEPPRFL